MTRRSAAHDYTRPGIYHITIHVADGLGQPLGSISGSDADTAAVVPTRVGSAVEHELLTAITAHYYMITVDAFVIMPEHLHFILIVRDPIVSKNGRPTHLGQVIAGFKAGCNRAYWAATGQDTPAAKPPCTVPAAPTPPASAPGGSAAPTPPASAPGGSSALTPSASAPGGSAARKPRFSTGRRPLFAEGYCDVQPLEPGQLETQRAYIRNNPRSRWLRSHDRPHLQTQRGGIDTALTPAALTGYLRRECHPDQATPEALTEIVHRLLLADGKIACDTYGNRTLLQHRLLPVVCHRNDRPLFEKQKARCLDEAAKGAVLVSPRIATGEQTIIDEAARRGFATVLIADNGFPDRYHPSTDRIDRCAAGFLLLITPWQYQYRKKDDPITVPFCKTMNCVAQALCRLHDRWWQQP